MYIFFEKKNLNLFESQEEYLILSTREEKCGFCILERCPMWSHPECKIIKMGSYMRMSTLYISFDTLLEKSEYHLLDIRLIICSNLLDDTARISMLNMIFREELLDDIDVTLEKSHPLHPIEMVYMGFFCKYSVPIGEIFFARFSFTDFSQYCISLADDILIVSSHTPKLSEGSFEDIIEEISTYTRSKIK